ncbi:MAG: hypothetical protein HY681_08775 [Chloroflexi bacterium]|nr:hypothetical protein [Chloroflexota bacterium]
MARSTWRLGGIRPQNHPKRRIAGAAMLFARAAQDSLAGAFEGRLREGNGASLFASLEASRDGAALIGRDRALDMGVNVVLPFLHARALLGGDEALAEAGLRLYRSAPKLADNELLREAAYLLGLPQGRLGRTACQQQGALHLYKRLLQEGDAHIYGATAGEGKALGESRRRSAPSLSLRPSHSVVRWWLPA